MTVKTITLIVLLAAPVAAQTPIISINLGGGGCALWGTTLSFSSPVGTSDIVPAWGMPSHPVSSAGTVWWWWPWTVLGFLDPNAVLPNCGGCVLHSDAVIMLPAPPPTPPTQSPTELAGWTVPPGVTGLTVQVQVFTLVVGVPIGAPAGQWAFLSFPGSCEVIGDVHIALSDGYTVVLP